MVKRTFRITNENGIHARPATTLVNEAMKYDCEVKLTAFKKTVDFKSIMGVMSLGIYSGTTIEIKTEGSDEDKAAFGLAKLICDLGLGVEI